MEKEYELKCRLDVCDTRERFDSTESAKESEWTEISPMGVLKDEALLHPAYCPGHSLDHED
jgi:hypothetical protein